MYRNRCAPAGHGSAQLVGNPESTPPVLHCLRESCVAAPGVSGSAGDAASALASSSAEQVLSLFECSGLSPDNARRAVNQFLVSVRRRGETASGKRRRGARLALQAGIDWKRRDAEVPKTRPVAELRTERDVNERAGKGAEKRIGSPSQAKGMPTKRDRLEPIDSEPPKQISTEWRQTVGGHPSTSSVFAGLTGCRRPPSCLSGSVAPDPLPGGRARTSVERRPSPSARGRHAELLLLRRGLTRQVEVGQRGPDGNSGTGGVCSARDLWACCVIRNDRGVLGGAVSGPRWAFRRPLDEL